VSLRQLRALLWLRWRLRVNQVKRAGVLNAIALAVVVPGVVLLGLWMFVGFFLVGLFALPQAPLPVTLLVWDGLAVVFLFSWAVGLLAELQRSEVLSLDKLLHHPISLGGAFLINYLSSLLSVNLAIYVPAMVGLLLGQTLSQGPAVLAALPLLLTFLLAVTALTYQFQGWLATMMTNPRRRRAVVAVLTLLLALVSQVPVIFNAVQPWRAAEATRHVETAAAQADLDRALRAGEITGEQYRERMLALYPRQQTLAERDRRQWEQVLETAWPINLAVPPGWLPLGVWAAADGNVLPALLGTVAFGLIGGASLWRSYRTTLRLYTGYYTRGRVAPAAVAQAPVKPRPGMVAWELPWLPEQAAAVALSGLRGLLRAPEARMLLLTPVLVTVLAGAGFVAAAVEPPPVARPLLVAGGMAVTLLGMLHLMGNLFGFDRAGFRVFVLCGASRRDVLVGKNLAFAPLALGLGLALAVLVEVFYPMRPDHLVALLPQMVAMFLLTCLAGNCLSILSPLPVPAGALRPASPAIIPVLMQMACLSLLMACFAPVALPWLVEFLLQLAGVAEGWPVALALSLVICGGVVALYVWLVGWQGVWLQAREQRILEVVAARAE
jgi:hypothetical protein